MARVQINLKGTSTRAGARWVVTQQWSMPTLPTEAQGSAIAAAARAALVASSPFKNSIGQQYSLVSVGAIGYLGNVPPAAWSVEASGAAVAGANPSVSAQIPLSVVVSERTGVAGPSYRGRSYWPGGTALADGSVTSTTQQLIRTGWLAAHTAVLGAFTGQGFGATHCVYSPKLGFMTPITTIRTGDRIDTARGRFGDAPEAYTSEALPASLAVEPTGAVGASVENPDGLSNIKFFYGISDEDWDAFSTDAKNQLIASYNEALHQPGDRVGVTSGVVPWPYLGALEDITGS